MAANTASTPTEIPSSGTKQAGIVLATVIVFSAVANLPPAMANVALPPDKVATLSAADQKVSGQQAANSEALHAWYTTAAALSKRAIKDSDPDNHQQLLELLNL